MRRGLLIGMLAAAVGACAGGDGSEDAAPGAAASSASTGSVDACSLLTPQEIEEVMGWAPGEPEGTPGAVGSRCRWEAASGDVRAVDLMITMRAPATFEQLDSEVRGSGNDIVPNVERANLGEFAVWGGAAGGYGMLFIVKSGKTLNVASTGPGSGREKSTAIAAKALARVR
jgi:hypothetical protein